MATKLKRMLGNGIYTVSEAAMYARVSPQMMSRWLFGSGQGKAVVRPQFGETDRVVSFLDFVQTLAIREIRLQRRIPLSKFRQAIRTAEQLGMKYPFARQHCTYLWGDELVIKRHGEEWVEASGKHAGQRLLHFVEVYLDDLSFSESGLAAGYRIFQCNDVAVTMNPEKRFGEPLLPSGYSALTIWDAICAEGGIEETSKAYGISREEVEAAYKFVDHLGRSVA